MISCESVEVYETEYVLTRGGLKSPGLYAVSGLDIPYMYLEHWLLHCNIFLDAW